jgi:hypothetical protein
MDHSDTVDVLSTVQVNDGASDGSHFCLYYFDDIYRYCVNVLSGFR